MNKKLNKNTKKATALVLVACMVMSIVGSFAYFTDRTDAKATATAGSLAINLDDSGIKLTDADGKDILNPGDVRDVNYTVTNVGNKSMDVKETITLSVYDSVGQPLNVKGSAIEQSEVDLYTKDDVTAYDTVDGYTLADGAAPVQVKTINNNVITYKPDIYTLNGNSNFDEQEVETGIDTDKHTTDLKLVFDKLAANSFQSAVVKMDVLVEAKQHRNTSAYDADWTELQTETYIFSNGASQNVVKAVNADVPEKLQLMTADGVAKAFAPSANMVIPSQLDGDTVTGIVDGAFKGETVIETVEIPASVTTIGTSAFEDCTNLNTLTLNEGLQTIKPAAFKNTALTTVNIPSTVTNLTADNKNDVFDDSNNIVFPETTANITIEVYINDIKNEKLTKNISKEIDSIITEDDTKAVVANSLPKYSEFIKTENTPLTVAKDGDNLIRLYYNLDTNQYTIDKTKFETLASEKTGTITFSTASLTEETVGTDLSVAGDDSVIGVVNSEDVTIYSKNGRTYAPEDSSQMFNLDSIHGFKASTIDCSGLDTSNVINMSSMFETCTNLTTLNVSNFNTENVNDMSNMFSSCRNLTNLNIESFNTSNVTNMKGMFASCSSLTKLDISKFDTSNVTNMQAMFSGCSGLTNLNLDNFNTSNVTNMGLMFNDCFNLTEFNLSKFNASKVTNMQAMFSGCSGLTSLNLSNFDTSNVTMMTEMFDGCTNLESIIFGDNFNTSNVTDMYYMFARCASLTELNLSGFDTSNVTDFEGIFQNCSDLTITVATEADKTRIETSDYFPSTCTVIVE